ncbi:MAG: PEP-CTERM sorting domain-containing protein [Verrucomicrobia bacterium]|nr:PEP-CTERM sorting domain-containing protein [Verrucomicrobiota bacterium]
MRISIILLGAFLTETGLAAPFQNLGFDEANTNSVRFQGRFPTSDLLPGWQLFQGNVLQTNILYNGALEFNYATIVDRSGTGIYGTSFTLGAYSLVLNDFADHFNLFTLVQRGDVPSDARFLSYTFAGSPFQVTINGQNLLPAVQNGAVNPIEILIDVSKYAGQNVQLTFSGAAGVFAPNDPAGLRWLDNIQFEVPEPGTVTLFGLGGCALLAAGLRRRRR